MFSDHRDDVFLKLMLVDEVFQLDGWIKRVYTDHLLIISHQFDQVDIEVLFELVQWKFLAHFVVVQGRVTSNAPVWIYAAFLKDKNAPDLY